MTACPNCGSENADGANIWSVCGTRLVPVDAETVAGSRKTVTVVFCDVTGSTERCSSEPKPPTSVA